MAVFSLILRQRMTGHPRWIARTKSKSLKNKTVTVVEKTTTNDDDTSNKEEKEFQRVVSSTKKDDKTQTNKFASFINPY